MSFEVVKNLALKLSNFEVNGVDYDGFIREEVYNNFNKFYDIVINDKKYLKSQTIRDLLNIFTYQVLFDQYVDFLLDDGINYRNLTTTQQKETYNEFRDIWLNNVDNYNGNCVYSYRFFNMMNKLRNILKEYS